MMQNHATQPYGCLHGGESLFFWSFSIHQCDIVVELGNKLHSEFAWQAWEFPIGRIFIWY